MRDRSTLAMLCVIAVCAVACGSERPPPMPDTTAAVPPVGGGSGGGTQPDYCTAYCAFIVASDDTCINYDANAHCTLICEWYRGSVCMPEYTAFTNCMKASSTISCFQNSSGVTGPYYPPECSTPYTAFKTCTANNNVDVCPYGSP